MNELTGRRFDFTVSAGMAEETSILVTDAAGAGRDLAGSVWAFGVFGAGYEHVELDVLHGSAAGELILQIPALAGGTYRWELSSIDDSGAACLFMRGELVAVSYESAKALQARARDSARRTLSVVTGEDFSVVLQARWLATSAAGAFAARAEVAAEKAEEMQGILLEGVEKSELALQRALEATDKLAALDEMLQEFQEEIYKQIQISSEDTWVIGGRDTRRPSRGEAGKCPDISPGGTWLRYDGVEWIDTGAPALGRDGLDGDTIVRLRVDSYGDIPQEGETCSGRYKYYVGADGGPYDVYEWFEERDGSARWVQVGEANDLATAEVYGLTRLGTDVPVAQGAPVGKSTQGQLMVPLATATTPGAIRIGSSVGVTNEQPYNVGISQNEREELMFNIANNGALMHMTGSDWAWERGVHGGSEGVDSDAMKGAGFYMGLRTGAQFSQSQADGLVLKDATNDLSGGVYVAGNSNDTRPNAVLSATKIRSVFAKKEAVYEKTETYPAEELYTKAEVEALVDAAVDSVKKWVKEGAPLEDVLPVGTVVFAACTGMTGWLRCDGRAVSRDSYKALFNLIGTKFGEGDGATTFNLPNASNRVLQGAHGNFGAMIEAGLPNVTGRYNEWCVTSQGYIEGGALYAGGEGKAGAWGRGDRGHIMMLDASRCSKVYGNSDTVQPPALALNVFIKF